MEGEESSTLLFLCRITFKLRQVNGNEIVKRKMAKIDCDLGLMFLSFSFSIALRFITSTDGFSRTITCISWFGSFNSFYHSTELKCTTNKHSSMQILVVDLCTFYYKKRYSLIRFIYKYIHIQAINSLLHDAHAHIAFQIYRFHSIQRHRKNAIRCK